MDQENERIIFKVKIMKANTNESNFGTKNPELDQLIDTYRNEVPNFYEEGISAILYVPVNDGEIKVFHYKPEKQTSKRPIIFLPGFGTTPLTWRDFHIAQHEKNEYYYVETRDKKSANIRRYRKTDLTINQIAKDIAQVVDFLGLSNQDYILMGACLSGGVILQGLIHNHLSPPTSILFDPFTKWTQNRIFVKGCMPFIPPFLLGFLKFIIARIVMSNMKNEAQKERNMDIVASAVPWKWRKFSLKNVNFDLTDDLKKIKNEVYVCHGPKDKYHPEGTFREVTKNIPKGKFLYMKTLDEDRQLLVGLIASEFAKITQKDSMPKSLQPFHVNLENE